MTKMIPERQRGNNMWKKMLPGVLISAVVIGVLFLFVDFKELIHAFWLVSWQLLVSLFLLQSASSFVRGLAWRTILDDAPTVSQAFFTVTEGNMLNLLPLRLGEIGRSVIMGGLIKKSPFMVFSTVLLERTFDLLITVLILFSTLPLLNGVQMSVTLYLLLFTVIIIVLAGLFWTVRNQTKFMALVRFFFRPDTKIGIFLLPKVESLLNGLLILREMKKFVVWLAWILTTWIFWSVTVIVGLKAFFPDFPTWGALFTQSVSALGGAIPAAPAGLGVIEGAYVFALGLLGISQSAALAAAIVLHGVGIVSSIIWGLIGFGVQGQNIKAIFQGLRSADLSAEE